MPGEHIAAKQPVPQRLSGKVPGRYPKVNHPHSLALTLLALMVLIYVGMKVWMALHGSEQ